MITDCHVGVYYYGLLITSFFTAPIDPRLTGITSEGRERPGMWRGGQRGEWRREGEEDGGE